jgi:hypothetical protein
VVSVVINVADGPVLALLTVTVTAADVVDWLRMSVAIAVNVWLPLVAVAMFHVVEYEPEPVTGAPRFAPSNWNCTEAIPAVELALALTFTDPETVPLAGLLRLTVGGGGVAELETVTDTAADVVFWLKESVAIAVSVWPPLDAVVVFQAFE